MTPTLFRNYDKRKRGVIAAKDLWHILAKWGEKLSAREGQCSVLSLEGISLFVICVNFFSDYS